MLREKHRRQKIAAHSLIQISREAPVRAQRKIQIENAPRDYHAAHIVFRFSLENYRFSLEALYAVAYVAAGVGCVSAAPRFGTRHFSRVALRGFGLSLLASARWLGLSLPSRCQRSRSVGCFPWNAVIIPQNRPDWSGENLANARRG